MLELHNLTKRYRNNNGVGPLNYTFQDGHIYGIVGPNGAGKSTFFNLLCGITTPQSGLLSIDGNYLTKRIPLDMLGFLPEQTFINPSFTPRQALAFDACMRAQKVTETQISEHLKQFHCTEFADIPTKALSQGMLKRADLALAFFPKPRYLVLDEPLNALDTQTIIKLRTQIQRAQANGQTLLISSHILSFIDELADEILFIDHGQIVATTTPTDGKAEDYYQRLFIHD